MSEGSVDGLRAAAGRVPPGPPARIDVHGVTAIDRVGVGLLIELARAGHPLSGCSLYLRHLLNGDGHGH